MMRSLQRQGPPIAAATCYAHLDRKGERLAQSPAAAELQRAVRCQASQREEDAEDDADQRAGKHLDGRVPD